MRTVIVAVVGIACAACASAAPRAPEEAPPPTCSALLLRDGGAEVDGAIRRVLLGGSSRAVELALELGAFNETISEEEQAAFVAFAQRVRVATGADVRDPARGARRLVWAMLCARAVATGDWDSMREWFRGAADEDARNDIAAGLAVTDWWPDGAVAAAAGDSELAARRDVLAEILASTTDAAARRRLVRNARGKLRLFPNDAAHPADARRSAAESLARLAQTETDPQVLDEIRASIAATGHVAPVAASPGGSAEP